VAQPHGAPPDLELLIFLDPDQKELRFVLNCAELGYVYQPVGTLKMGQGNPQVPIGELNELARDRLGRTLRPHPLYPKIELPDVSELETGGKALWLDMIPQALKQAYVRFRENVNCTLFIVSNDPSFPWELVSPFELSEDPFFDDRWLALRFSIARWISGVGSPASEIALKRICCVAASSSLSSAEREIEHFESLVREQGAVLAQPSTKADLIDRLSTESFDVIHFACHGQFNTDRPGESVVLLPDGSLLKPNDLLIGTVPKMIKQCRPLVFINACHSGRTGSTLIGLEGWAKRFIEIGCGAVIGCGWEVNDPLAAEFATTFYKAFGGGKMTLGRAVHHARLTISETNRNNSTWLAYYLYGNPNCRLKP
jgi:hypothetical protein